MKQSLGIQNPSRIYLTNRFIKGDLDVGGKIGGAL